MITTTQGTATMICNSFKCGFSLVELSIVLVILGLLVGGVLSGQSLIRASELRTITTEYNEYSVAVNSFKDKYFGIPGDLKNATDFWGENARCGVSATDFNKGTCNGTGDGYVTDYTSDNAFEPTMFWGHLASAGLIKGGFADKDPTNSDIGINIPQSRISGGFWMVETTSRGSNTCNSSGVSNYDLYGKSRMQTMALSGTGGSFASMYGMPCAGVGIINAAEAWNIDTKIDDGKPNNGKLLVANQPGTISGCIDGPPSNGGSTVTSGNYQLGDTTKSCRLFFVMW